MEKKDSAAVTPGQAAYETWNDGMRWEVASEGVHAQWERAAQAGHAVIVAQQTPEAVTPGKTAHDAYCAEDDWHTLDAETRALWVTVEDDVIGAYGGSR